jgi:hypothetical protein
MKSLGGLETSLYTSWTEHAQLLVDTMTHSESEQSYALDTDGVVTNIADTLMSIILLLTTQQHQGIAHADAAAWHGRGDSDQTLTR